MSVRKITDIDPKRPRTIQDVIRDKEFHDGLLKIARGRYRQSADYIAPWLEKFVRFFKIYRSLVDELEDSDEPNTTVAYAYGVIEDLVSRLAEPILSLKPPCRVQAKKAGHEEAAANFATIASNYFQSSRYQMDFTMSIRELCICGNSWEQDCWLDEWVQGKKWAKVQKKGLMAKIKSAVGGALGFDDDISGAKPVEYDHGGIEEVPQLYPWRVGYHTEFPWIFDMFPEPGIKNVRDMHWLLMQQRSVSIKDLERSKRRDPVTKQMVNNFDFTLLRESGLNADGSVNPQKMDEETDYGEDLELALSGKSTDELDDGDAPTDSSDKVFLMWVFEPDRIFAVANNGYVVFYAEHVFHVPRIPFRLKTYTPQKEFLYAMGALEPVENMIYELWDTHKLAMQNWVRMVHKMVAYNEDAVPYPDDFKPRAGGRIRVRTATSVHHEIASIDHPDVTPSMLAQESNTKGLLEKAVAVTDFSPGVEGTKQHHKTLGGLMEIARNTAQRTTTIRRMILADKQDQMWFMEKMYSQHLFDKQPFAIYGPDGSTSPTELDMWDISTDGIGFDFIIEYDPSFGDDALLRNQMMVLLDVCIKYNGALLAQGMDKMAYANLEDVMRRAFKAFGWADTSKVLQKRDETIDPDSEFKMFLQGVPVAPKEADDHVKHLIDHTIQADSPMLAEGIKTGKIPPVALFLLTQHSEAHKAAIDKVRANPSMAARMKIARTITNDAMAGRLRELPQNVSPETAPAAAEPVPEKVPS